jgi:probable HAF family extracellular repeat protein
MTSNRSVSATVFLAINLWLGSLSNSGPAFAESFTITDLGTLGGVSSSGWGINADAQIVGQSVDAVPSPKQKPFLYNGTTMQDLGSLEVNGDGVSLAINGASQIVGYASVASGDHAFLCDARGR